MTAHQHSLTFPPTTAASLNNQLDALVRLHGLLGSELLKHSLDALSEFSFVTDENGKIHHANPVLNDCLGEISGNPLQWLEERPTSNELPSSGLSGAAWIPSLSGRSVPGFMAIRPSGAGSIGIIRTFAENETSRADEASADKTATHCLLLVEQATEGFASIAKDGSLEFLNPAFAAAHSPKAASQLIGSPWSSLLTEDDARRFHSEILPSMGFTGNWGGSFAGRDFSFSARSDGGLLVCSREDRTASSAQETERLCQTI